MRIDNNRPKVSVVIGVYKVEKYIADCINSLVAQTFKEFEIILVDNNTNDQSIEIASGILDNTNIKYKVVIEAKQGASCAKNRGILEASGEWIAFSDPDDTVAKDWLETLVNIAEKHNTNVVLSGFQFVTEKNKFKSHSADISTKLYEKKEFEHLFLTRRIKPIVPGMLIKKKVFNNADVFNDETMKMGEDTAQLWKIIASCDNIIVFCKTKLYNYYMHSQSLTTEIDLSRQKSCHEGFLVLQDLCRDKLTEESIYYMTVREDFGLIRSTARFGSYSVFRKSLKLLCDSEYRIRIKTFPDYRVRGLAMLCDISPVLFYLVNKI